MPTWKHFFWAGFGILGFLITTFAMKDLAISEDVLGIPYAALGIHYFAGWLVGYLTGG